MTDKGPGGDGGPRYTVYARTIKKSVIGDEADQRNQHPARAKGLTVLAAVATVAALAAVAVLAVVLLGGGGAPVASGRPAPSGPPGPPPTPLGPPPSPTSAPTPPPTSAPAPDRRTSRPPDTPSSAPGPPPAPRPTVHAPGPPTAAEPQPSRPPPCPLRKEYRVTNKAQLWNAEGEHIGDVASGTLFFRQENAAYPAPVDDRYYGTVDQALSGSATGYVLRKKLDYVGTVAFCRATAG